LPVLETNTIDPPNNLQASEVNPKTSVAKANKNSHQALMTKIELQPAVSN